MKKQTEYFEIYEQEGVYGDDEKYFKSNLRFKIMYNWVKNMKKKPMSVLDIGCGTGYFANEVKNLYPTANVSGIDISTKALIIGKQKYKKISLIHGNAEKKLPFQSNTFDLVISGEHLEHIADTDTYITEINRVMKKGSALIITTPNLASWLNRLLMLFGRQPFLLEPSMRKNFPSLTILGKTIPDKNSLPSGHLRLYTFSMLKTFLNHYGFEVKESKGSPLLKSAVLTQIDWFFSFIPSLSIDSVLYAVKR